MNITKRNFFLSCSLDFSVKFCYTLTASNRNGLQSFNENKILIHYDYSDITYNVPESRPETSAREHLTTGLSYQHDESSPPFCHAKENTSKLSTHTQHAGTLNCSVFFSFHLVSISVRDRIANGVLFLHPHSDSIRQRAFLFKLHTHSLSRTHTHMIIPRWVKVTRALISSPSSC